VIARLNRIRRAHPALQNDHSLRFHATDNELLLCYSKRAGDDTLLVVVNLDPLHTHRGWLSLDLAALDIGSDDAFQVHDLLGGAHYSWRGPRNFVELVPDQSPAHIFEVRRFVRSENNFEYFL
jgi:starch synthase (maltosyl-transferring)